MSVRTQLKGLHGVSGLGVGEQVRPEGLRRGERRTRGKKGEVQTDTEVKGTRAQVTKAGIRVLSLTSLRISALRPVYLNLMPLSFLFSTEKCDDVLSGGHCEALAK